jgi:hypothetical protein
MKGEHHMERSSNGSTDDDDIARMNAIVDRIEQDIARVPIERNVPAGGDQTHTPTALIMQHMESTAEKAVQAQCSVIHQLITTARDLEQMLMADLVRTKATIRTMLQHAERAAAMSQSMTDALQEMRNQRDDTIEARTIRQ